MPVGRTVFRAALGTCVVVTALAVPAAPAQSRQNEPPALPTVTDGCVGASPVTATGMPWAVARLGPSAAWPLTRGAGVTVAVVDSGVSATAPALRGAVTAGRDVTDAGRADRDCLGRGTTLAGIVAARPVSGTAVVGIAPAATVLPIRITGRDGRVPPTGLADGIRAATTLGADVILVGTGRPGTDDRLASAVAEAVARDIVVVAAVDDRSAPPSATAAPPWYPAAFPQVLAVGGIDPDGVPTEDSPPSASVDLVAPATGAVSVAPAGPGHYRVGGPAVAAAYVAGAAALVRSYRPELTQAQVRDRLRLTAEPPSAPGDPRLGAGTVDPYAAVTTIDPTLADTPTREPVPPAVLASVPAPDPAVRRAAVATTLLLLSTAVALLSIAVLRRGRRRRWNPR
ncbi:S8 family serine peptidase [Verrucosispora sp. NA02020]|uniref:S8 family serine peptidase n=1 Tax=Verrucosispora sp. NA02020 TaxID=2742132 RepID=UPI003D705EA0